MKAVNGLLVALVVLGFLAAALLQRKIDRLSQPPLRKGTSVRTGAVLTLRPRPGPPKAEGGSVLPPAQHRPSAGNLGAAQAKAWLAGKDGRQLRRKVARERLSAAIISQYGPLLRSLNLDAATDARFAGLIAEERLTAVDAYEAANANGIQTPQGYVAAIREAVGEVDQQLEALLGPDDFQAFAAYRQMLPEEETTAQLAQSLTGTDTPLTEGQQAQLVPLFNQMETPAYRQNEDLLGIMGVQEAPLTSAMVGTAAGVLAPPQTEALRDIYDNLLARSTALRLLQQRAP